MENTENNMVSYSSPESTRTASLTVVAGLLVLAGLIWWVRQPQTTQHAQTSPKPDTETAAINKGVDGISVGDLNSGFDAMDKEINGL